MLFVIGSCQPSTAQEAAHSKAWTESCQAFFCRAISGVNMRGQSKITTDTAIDRDNEDFTLTPELAGIAASYGEP